ncbi:alpha-ketoglutarate-dependent dioxygenase AlkB [Alcanivorax jadensis]|uniref:alpha-ketoglutarate-dependent dioxygenase AlkB family protein n=1 Tax=Alcanivorax jadensis TaxID=64988 RepID=UPI0035662952
MTVNDSRAGSRNNAPQLITLAGEARLWLWRDALPAQLSQSLQTALNNELDWQQPRIQVFGRYHTVPRLTAWHGDEGIPYRYSGHRHVAAGWPEVLRPVRDSVSELCGYTFNSVLANRYRNGEDCMGYHSDDEPELGPEPWIASYSLGAERDFVFRPRGGGRQCLCLALPDNSLLLMSPEVQRGFQHALPRRQRVQAERLNLTFRRILTPVTPRTRN